MTEFGRKLLFHLVWKMHRQLAVLVTDTHAKREVGCNRRDDFMAEETCCVGQRMLHYGREALQPAGMYAELERLPVL